MEADKKELLDAAKRKRIPKNVIEKARKLRVRSKSCGSKKRSLSTTSTFFVKPETRQESDPGVEQSEGQQRERGGHDEQEVLAAATKLVLALLLGLCTSIFLNMYYIDLRSHRRHCRRCLIAPLGCVPAVT